MYTTIEIDFEVFKEITSRRKTPDTTENDVLRSLLDLPKNAHSLNGVSSASPQKSSRETSGKPWVWKGVKFPHGTEFRAEYKGMMYHARAEDGALVYDGNLYKSPSAAARAATGNSVNGWIFWDCRLPGSNDWKLIDNLR